MKMKRIINTLLCSTVLLLAASCIQQELVIETPVNESIVLDLSSGLTKAADTDTESYVDHIDVFIFKASGSSPAERLVYEYFTVNNASSVTLQAKRTDFTADEGYFVYLVANSTLDLSDVESYADLRDKMQEDINLHLTGLAIENAPKYFLMDAVAEDAQGNSPVVLYNGKPEDNTILSAELKRAAAKVVVNVTAGEGVTFMPYDIEEGSEGGLYYVRNLPYDTYLLAETLPANQILNAKLVTTGKTDSGYFTWAPETEAGKKKVSLTTYVYPHHWADASILDKETCVIMNLPMDYKKDAESESQPYHNSWYKIPMTDNQTFERNNYYEVNITLHRPGAVTESKPVILEDIYYAVDEWTSVNINISEATKPSFLQLNTDHVDMYNVNTDNTTLEFASSSEITEITLNKAYFRDYLDKEVNVKSRYPDAYNGIKAVADAGLSGRITITSPFVDPDPDLCSHSNAIRYMEFTVKTATDQVNFTVAQYPTIYITNKLGNYSYRSDFGGTHLGHTGSPNYSGVNWSTSLNGWDYEQQASFNSQFFASKYVYSGPDSRGNYDIECVYRNGNRDVRVQDGTFNNPRMYHVHVTATSSSYIVARPRLDEDGFTESSPENTKLVSPSFMIASQLGATNIPGGFGGGFGGSLRQLPGGVQQAKMHCEQYIEVGADGTIYDDWRLPTAAEIEIIARHQYASDAMAEVLSGSRYYCAYNIEQGFPDHTKSSEGGNSGSCHVRCIRDVY